MISSAELYGLVLAGGKSSRMGKDKGLLEYYDTNQRTRLYRMLEPLCSRTFISCRADQEAGLDPGHAYIVDEDLYGGPLNGILSAMHAFPEVAWLVVAVDLPHLQPSTLERLVGSREPDKVATAYATHESGLPEPMIAIYEPAALAAAERYLDGGRSCARKFLLGEEIAYVFPDRDEELFNANFPEEYVKAKGSISEG